MLVLYIMYPALRKGPLFTKNTSSISFPAYRPALTAVCSAEDYDTTAS